MDGSQRTPFAMSTAGPPQCPRIVIPRPPMSSHKRTARHGSNLTIVNHTVDDIFSCGSEFLPNVNSRRGCEKLEIDENNNAWPQPCVHYDSLTST